MRPVSLRSSSAYNHRMPGRDLQTTNSLQCPNRTPFSRTHLEKLEFACLVYVWSEYVVLHISKCMGVVDEVEREAFLECAAMGLAVVLLHEYCVLKCYVDPFVW